MPNLDIYLQDNGLLEYSRDLALTQYSTTYYIRLFTKRKYFVITMNATLGNGLNTYNSRLDCSINKENGYFVYMRNIGPEITGYEFSGDKTNIRVAFYLYPDENDLSQVTTTSIVYIPLLKSLEDRPPDGTITNSELLEIRSRLARLQSTLADLGAGESERAKDYNTSEGTIQSKFGEIEAELQNLSKQYDKLSSSLGAFTDPVSGEITQTVAQALTQLENTRLQLLEDLDEVQSKLSEVDSRLDATDDIANDIAEIRSAISAGLRYEVVESLPTGSSRMEGVIYLVPDNTGVENNIYTEYMWFSNHWEKLGTSRSEIDLANYAQTSDLDSRLLQQYNQIKSEVAQDIQSQSARIGNAESSIDNIGSTLLNKADKATTLAGYGITDAYRKSEVDTALSNLETRIGTEISGEVDALRQDTQAQFTTQGQELISLQSDIDSVADAAREALATARSKIYSKTFNTKSAMLAWLHTEPTDADRLMEGSDVYIKDASVPDYWVAAVYDTPQSYTNAKGEVFEDVYYALEQIEVNLENYYTKSETDDAIEDAIDAAENRLNTTLGDKEALSNKSTTIDSLANDTEYPTTLAVKTYVENEINEAGWVTTAAHEEAIGRLQDAITEEATARSEADTELDGRIDSIGTDISNEITRATGAEEAIAADLAAEISTRESEDTRILGEAEAYADDIDTGIRSDLESGELAPKLTEGVKDFIHNDRIRFTTDLSNKDFEITAIDITTLQEIMSGFEANSYNNNSNS